LMTIYSDCPLFLILSACKITFIYINYLFAIQFMSSTKTGLILKLVELLIVFTGNT